MSQSPETAARISPLAPPYAADVQARFDRIMPPGVPPLTLFRVMARDDRLYQRFAGASLLDPGHLSLRQREIVIDRVTARCGSEYEWGVHVAFFGKRAELTQAQLVSLVHGSAIDPCWSQEDRVLIEVADSLERQSDICDDLWQRACGHFSAHALIEITMLAGFYRMVSYLTNALRLPLEPYAARFPASAISP